MRTVRSNFVFPRRNVESGGSNVRRVGRLSVIVERLTAAEIEYWLNRTEVDKIAELDYPSDPNEIGKYSLFT